jgi:hypothetical protein
MPDCFHQQTAIRIARHDGRTASATAQQCGPRVNPQPALFDLRTMAGLAPPGQHRPNALLKQIGIGNLSRSAQCKTKRQQATGSQIWHRQTGHHALAATGTSIGQWMAGLGDFDRKCNRSLRRPGQRRIPTQSPVTAVPAIVRRGAGRLPKICNSFKEPGSGRQCNSLILLGRQLPTDSAENRKNSRFADKNADKTTRMGKPGGASD